MLHLLHEPHGVVREGGDVGAAHLIIGAGIQTGGSHVGATNRLDLLQLPEPLLTDDLETQGDPETQLSRQRGQTQPCPSAHSLPCLGPLPLPPALLQQFPPF